VEAGEPSGKLDLLAEIEAPVRAGVMAGPEVDTEIGRKKQWSIKREGVSYRPGQAEDSDEGQRDCAEGERPAFSPALEEEPGQGDQRHQCGLTPNQCRRSDESAKCASNRQVLSLSGRFRKYKDYRNKKQHE